MSDLSELHSYLMHQKYRREIVRKKLRIAMMEMNKKVPLTRNAVTLLEVVQEYHGLTDLYLSPSLDSVTEEDIQNWIDSVAKIRTELNTIAIDARQLELYQNIANLFENAVAEYTQTGCIDTAPLEDAAKKCVGNFFWKQFTNK